MEHMEQMNLILKIQSAFNQFTKAEKKVAEYCLANREKVLFLSITDLAEACGVGEASVFRFCRTLGLSGYQEFKMQMSLSQTFSGAKETADREDGREDGQTGDGEGARKRPLTDRVLEAHQLALRETRMLLDEQQLERMLDFLDQAKRVYFFGISDSLLVAQEARNKFLRLTDKVICVEDSHLMAVTASMLSEQDFLVVVSYSGATKDVIQTVRLAKKSGAGIGAITHYRKSPLTDLSDAVLLCGGQEGPMDRGSLAAKTGQLYLVDLLYQGYFERNEQQCLENRKKAIAAVVDKVY